MPLPKPFVLPNSNIQTLAPVAELDFFDSQSMPLMSPCSPLTAWNVFRARPKPVLQWAFAIRDRISSLFGVKTIGGFGQKPQTSVKVGDMLDFFLVEHVSDDVLSLTARDRHLDVMTCISTTPHQLTITSSVKVHNRFGRVYMLPVAPAHRLIVAKTLKDLRDDLIKSR